RDAPAVTGRAVPADGAARRVQNAKIADPATVPGGRLIDTDGRVCERDCFTGEEILDAAAEGRGVPGDRTVLRGHAADAIADATRIDRGRIAGDRRTRQGDGAVIRDAATVAEAGINVRQCIAEDDRVRHLRGARHITDAAPVIIGCPPAYCR